MKDVYKVIQKEIPLFEKEHNLCLTKEEKRLILLAMCTGALITMDEFRKQKEAEVAETKKELEGLE